MQNVGAQIGNQVLGIEFLLDVAAQVVGIMFNLFYLFAGLFEFFAFLFGQIDADAFLKVMPASSSLSWNKSILFSSDLVWENKENLR